MQNEQSYDLAGRKLFVALPAYDFKVSLKLAVSLARLAQQLPHHGIELNIGSICGCSVVSRARNLLVKDFLESNSTDLMFIDADINFEPEDVLRLMAWASDPSRLRPTRLPLTLARLHRVLNRHSTPLNSKPLRTQSTQAHSRQMCSSRLALPWAPWVSQGRTSAWPTPSANSF